jgi:cytochrome c oxidase subunit 2
VLEFRLKQDAVPGLTIPMWFEALEVGEYDLICMELCGWGHYKMAGRVRVVSREDYDDWLETKQAEFMSNGMEEGS